MGACIRYYSQCKRKMLTDFLGLIQVVNCTGKALADALVLYLEKIKLPLKQFWAIGTDGAPNMCGSENSFFTHLRLLVPHLQLITCVCHSLHKCAEYACKKLPDSVFCLLTDTPNYFAHSAKRWDSYTKYYQERNPEKQPLRLKSLAKTRWLVWLPVSSTILDQFTELRGFFNREALANDNDHKAKELAKLFNDNANLLYLTFLRTMLREVQKVNSAFESENPDVTKIYSDVRNLVFSMARRVLQPQVIPDTSRPGMLRTDEVEVLKNAFKFRINILPIDRMNFGDSYKLLIKTVTMSEAGIIALRKCADFAVKLCQELLERVPKNLPTIKKLRFLTPRMALAKVARPEFEQLPLELTGSTASERDELQSTWISVGELTLPDVCPHADLNGNLDEMDIVHFWGCVQSMKNGAGETPFAKLANAALQVLTLPVSNATIERVFSLLSHVKSKRRNRLNLEMLDSLLRLRVHLKVDGLCCIDFAPNKDMLARFNSSIYFAKSKSPAEVGTGSARSRSSDTAEEGAPEEGAAFEEAERATANEGEKEVLSQELEGEDYHNVATMFDNSDDDFSHVACFVTISSALLV